jgi:hypothetical protein
MMRTIPALSVALILGACAGSSNQVALPQYYESYKLALMDEISHVIANGPYAATPGPVKLAYEECSADYVMSGFTEAERAKLDAFARQEITMTAAEGRAMEDRARARLGGNLSYDTLDRLSAICPDKVPLFKQHFKPI